MKLSINKFQKMPSRHLQWTIKRHRQISDGQQQHREHAHSFTTNMPTIDGRIRRIQNGGCRRMDTAQYELEEMGHATTSCNDEETSSLEKDTRSRGIAHDEP